MSDTRPSLHVVVSACTASRNPVDRVFRNRATTRQAAGVTTPNALGH